MSARAARPRSPRPTWAAYLANPRETVDPAGDERGPFAVGVLATAQPTSPLMADRTDIQTRLIVFGDADFATDQVIGQEQGNLTLVTNAINWLGEEESLIAIQPRELLWKPAVMSADEGTFVFLFSIWLYPAVIFLNGNPDLPVSQEPDARDEIRAAPTRSSGRLAGRRNARAAIPRTQNRRTATDEIPSDIALFSRDRRMWGVPDLLRSGHPLRRGAAADLPAFAMASQCMGSS